MLLGQALKHRHDLVRLLVPKPQQDDATVTSGRVLPRITEAQVEGHQRAPLCTRSSEHDGIGPAAEVLVDDNVDVVAEMDEWLLCRDGDVLVELDLHVLGESGRISCLASHAPYAIAARTPSTGRVG